ncbi:TlpA family protein disulfide reductase [Mangrovibacillus cuniculi]|uniref:TlpA family protein disulfide reductase n=1 Tax=Mangrovibacillus cuniculi TaxID=2593652 RepID=A0A7S8HF56_9BACI|nr:TlpA disulfide reductase family protein [Mangrovibacillus cuniculi]QPC46463.1 TlpA family protein disulfide reductase [Mangrovibacillus cuniculi]
MRLKICTSLIILFMITFSTSQLVHAKQAPTFALEDLNGKTVTLDSFKGEDIILHFWATWCTPCKDELPAMEEVVKQMDIAPKIITINVDSTAQVKKFIEKSGVTLPVLLDKNNKIQKEYSIFAVPTTIYIDKDGFIKKEQFGAMDPEQWYFFIKENMEL